jgi:dienelactone hydrolase
VGVVGFCMGGALSLASGALVDSIDCAISFYGTPDPSLVRCICFPGGTQANARPLQTHHDWLDHIYPRRLQADMSKITKPVQGHFGTLDSLAGFSDAAAADELELNLTGGDKIIYRYPGVGHAFSAWRVAAPRCCSTHFAARRWQLCDVCAVNDTAEAIARKEELGMTGGDSGAIHDPEAIELAWNRVFEFFGQHLHTN